MKCIGVSIGNTWSIQDKTLEQFVAHAHDWSCMKGQWRDLAFALSGGNAWSMEYSFSVRLIDDHQPSLTIHYPESLEMIEHPLMFTGENGVSVRGVEDAVRVHLWKLHEEVLARIAQLQKDADNLAEAAFQITIDKAKAAVVAAFPEADGADYIPCQAARHDLYAFAHNGIENVHSNPVYVVRVVGGEAVGGIARIESTVFTWCGMREEERLECFWAELAWTFAALNFLPTDEPHRRGHVLSTEVRSEVLRNLHGTDPYHVDKAVFPAHGKQDIVVEFGSDNLPAKAYLATPVVGLIDMASS